MKQSKRWISCLPALVLLLALLPGNGQL